MLTFLPLHEPSVRIALAATVKDERPLLRSHLLYHRRLGISRAFVFDDGSSDGTAASVADLPFVEVWPSVDAAGYAGREGLQRAAARASRDYVARQNLNVQCALDLAREAGDDWLVHVDADELLVAEGCSAAAGALTALLEALPADVEAVRFPTLEAAQTRLEYGALFLEQTLFKRASPRLRRSVPDPYTGAALSLGAFYGHAIGKSAVRLRALPQPENVHAFLGPGRRRLVSVERGALLHYFSHGFADFARKHRLLPPFDDYVSGARLEPHKALWKRMAQDPGFGEARLREYYERHILFTPAELARLRRTRRFGIWPVEPAIVEVTGARDALRELGLLDTPGPGSG